MSSASTLTHWFREFAPYLWRVTHRMGVRDADVDDICQEVFLVAHRRRDDFAGHSSPKTWLYGICLRVVADYKRRAHVRLESPVARMPEEAQESGPAEALEAVRARLQLDQALGRLDENHRAVVVLYEIEELTLRETAEVLAIPLQTAYSRLKGAREALIEVFTETSAPAGAARVGGRGR